MLRAVLNRPISILIATVSLVAIGGFSLLRLPVSLLPTLERPRLSLELVDGDRSREEWLNQIVEPLERRLLAIDGVVEVHGTIDDGRSHLILETEWQTDVDRLRIDVERRLAEIAHHGLEHIEVRLDAGDQRAILAVAVVGGGSAHVRTAFADDVLLPELGRLRGAGELRRIGGAARRPVVRPLAASLAARDLTPGDVISRLEQVGESQPLGQVRDGARVRALQWREAVDDLTGLRALRLGDRQGTVLADVAEVSLEEIPSEGFARFRGQDAVLIEVHRAPGANAVLLARQVREQLTELNRRAPGGLRIEIVRDGSREVIAALLQLALAGGIGLALGTLVLRFMLGSFRPTLALAVVVPASIAVAFGAFYAWDVSLDAVSLAGLALAVGMLIDNSIVVLEAIGSAHERGEEQPEIAGTEQIALALVASLLTTAVVFLPLIYLRGLARAFFGVQAFAIVSTLAISLVFSLTLTPVLAKSARGRAGRGRSPGLRLYRRLLAGALRSPILVLMATLLVLLAGAWMLPQLPRQLIPDGPAHWLDVELKLPAHLERSVARQRLIDVEIMLSAIRANWQPELTLYDPDTRFESDKSADAVGRLELAFPDSDALQRALPEIRHLLERQPGLRATLQPRRGAVADALRETRDLEIEASAASPERAAALGERLARDLKAALGLSVADDSKIHRGRPALAMHLEPARLAALASSGAKIDKQQIADQVRRGLGQLEAGRLDLDEIEDAIWIEQTLPAALPTLPIRLGGATGGAVVPLATLARVEARTQPAPLERRHGRPSQSLRLDAENSDPGQLQTWLEARPLAADEALSLRGRAEEILRSFAQLRLALGLALVLIFLTMAALYESLTLPLVVMITVPTAAAGALVALYLGAQSLNVMSFLGLILLTGIVVNNAIVLIHRVEQHRKRLPLREALQLGAQERYRPILMTTLTTLLGMLPLALLGGEGIELRRALAIAASGGLVTSFFATLFAVPVLYQGLARRDRATQAEVG